MMYFNAITGPFSFLKNNNRFKKLEGLANEELSEYVWNKTGLTGKKYLEKIESDQQLVSLMKEEVSKKQDIRIVEDILFHLNKKNGFESNKISEFVKRLSFPVSKEVNLHISERQIENLKKDFNSLLQELKKKLEQFYRDTNF